MATHVYRLQTADGFGAYRNSVVRSGLIKYYAETGNTDKHPLPYEDAKLRPLWNEIEPDELHNYYFGFCSIEQFKNWFFKESWRKELSQIGVKMYVFEVDDEDVLVGDTQAVFLRDNATLISIHDVLEFDEVV